MLRPRIIPVLLLKGLGLVKGIRFKNFTYIGDPVNAVKIFNEKLVDELLFLDISATSEKRKPNLGLIEQIADECFMPFAVGGGIGSVQDVREIFACGAEKISINTAAVERPRLIREIADNYGSQSVIVAIDFKKNWRGQYRVYTHSGRKKTSLDPIAWAVQAEAMGAGEIFFNSIERDGTMQGYDLEITRKAAETLSIPLIAGGGAGTPDDLATVIHSGKASAAAAGSMFVFHGRKRGILINFPAKEVVEKIIGTQAE